MISLAALLSDASMGDTEVMSVVPLFFVPRLVCLVMVGSSIGATFVSSITNC